MVSISGAVISRIAIFSMASNTDFAETKVDDSFLSDYVIASVEYPSDHENGKCTIHFASDHSDLHMQVNLKDGWRDGDGLILREDGSLSIKVHFTDGVLDGEVTKYDDNKHVVLKGCVSQGEETGLFIEYDEKGNEVWSGYYRHGTRRVELKKSQELTDFYEERDSLGAVKNVSHFDPSRLCKDGLSFELASGKVSRVSEYRDGSLQRIAMEMKNDVLTEYDENGKKVYEGGYCGNMKTGFLREGKGTEYASDGETAVYIGEWRKGKRNGTGVEYKDGQVVFNGNWKDGRRVANKKTKKELPVARKKKTSKSWTYLIWIIVIVVVIGVVIGIVALSGRSSDQATFSSCDELTSFPENKEAAIKELRFKKGCECKKEISLSRFVNCEKIEIESEALTRLYQIDISGMSKLKELVVGDGSCESLNELIVKDTRFDQLSSIRIGSNALNGLTMVPFSSFGNVDSIVIGSSSLNYLLSVTLTSMDSLESFNINSFHSLNQLIIGSSSLNNLNAISFNSTSLNRLIIESNCLMQLKSIELNELNSVSVMSIGSNSMRGLESLRIGSVSRRILSSFGISTCSTNDCMIVNESIPFGNLKQLVILNGVMNQLNQFVVSGMSELNSIVIGDRSVRGVSSSSDSLFTISNCSNLKSIRIGAGSVVNYKRFVLNRLNKLESLSFGLNSLSSVERMELSSISLKQLAFGSNELGNTRELVISELNGLERVVIGDRSFRMGENERNDGLLRIQNCSQLKSIECNDGSFEDYESIELNGLASLQSLVFGSNCFKLSSSLSLNGLNELRTIRFGSSTFTQLASLPTNLLSQLTSLAIGSSALAQLQSLPLHLMTSLQSLSLGNNSLPQIHSLDISNLQSLRSFHTESNSLTAIESLRLGNNSFQTMKSFGLSPCSTGNCFSFSSQSVFGHIKTMEILSNSFTSFTSFDVTGALQLQTLMIGSSSFLGNPSTSSSFRISNCPTLTSLSVGSNSFLYYTSLALMNMTSLHSCSIGNATFNSLARVEMRSVGLEVIELADHQLPNLDSFVLDGMDNLVGVTVGTGNAITTSDYSVFSVANCQSISTLVIGDGSFRNATDLSITSNPALTTIQMGDDVFHEVHHALFSGLPCVVLSPRLVLSP